MFRVWEERCNLIEFMFFMVVFKSESRARHLITSREAGYGSWKTLYAHHHLRVILLVGGGTGKEGKGTETRVPNNESVRRSELGASDISMETFPAPARARSGGSRVPTLRFKTHAKSGIFRIPFLSLLTAETIQSGKSRAAWRPAWKSWRNMLRHFAPPRDVASCVACVILRQISSMQL